jgi:hypothetical protein
MTADNEKRQDGDGIIPPVPCRGCAILLIEKCYQRHWWFHLIRDPLVWGMKLLARRHGIDAFAQPVRKTYCRGCVRFIKNGLEERSATFRFLNRMIGPCFGKLRNSLVTDDELKAARQKALDANVSK